MKVLPGSGIESFFDDSLGNWNVLLLTYSCGDLNDIFIYLLHPHSLFFKNDFPANEKKEILRIEVDRWAMLDQKYNVTPDYSRDLG